MVILNKQNLPSIPNSLCMIVFVKPVYCGCRSVACGSCQLY